MQIGLCVVRNRSASSRPVNLSASEPIHRHQRGNRLAGSRVVHPLCCTATKSDKGRLEGVGCQLLAWGWPGRSSPEHTLMFAFRPPQPLCDFLKKGRLRLPYVLEGPALHNLLPLLAALNARLCLPSSRHFLLSLSC